MKCNLTEEIGIAVVLAALVAAGVHAQTTLYTLDGDLAGDEFGFAVSGAGDVNGDGFPDFIVGAPGDDNNGVDSGSARVFSGMDGSALYTFHGDSAGDEFGFAVSGAGDVNDDGFADVIVGAPYAEDGMARVLSGSDGSVLYTFTGPAGDLFGHAVSGAGDLNGDSHADVFVGSFFGNNPVVYSGIDGSVLYSFAGGAGLGFSVSDAGDVNGDGFPDLIAGALFDDGIAGSASVFSGSDGSTLYTFGGYPGVFFGLSVSGAGDVNGDGFADVVVGSLGENGAGSVRAFSGFDGSVLHTFFGTANNDEFGHSVNGAGDVDEDGYADIIVGAIFDSTISGNKTGSAWVFSGFDGSTLYTFDGASEFEEFGHSVTGAGDLDGDGCLEIILAAHHADDNGQDAGRVHVVTLPCAPLNQPPVVGSITGPQEPVAVDTEVPFSADFTDPDLDDIHTVVWDFGDGVGHTCVTGVDPECTIAFDDGTGTTTASHYYDTPGVYTVTVTVTDASGASDSAESQFVVIYDPDGGFVTGGGWIDSPEGSYAPDPTLTGKSTFGFHSKYQKGATAPTGNTSFRFQVADLKFSSEAYDWLIVAGHKAQFKGIGAINGAGDYGFMLTAIDEALTPSQDVDSFRIKIWDRTVMDTIVYDNRLGDSDATDSLTEIGGGSIVIHKPKK